MEFTIDCSTCLRHQGDRQQGDSQQGDRQQGVTHQSDGCQDCVVMFLTNREPDEAVVVDAAEFAALRRLAKAGLIPSVQRNGQAEVHWITDTEREVG